MRKYIIVTNRNGRDHSALLTRYFCCNFRCEIVQGGGKGRVERFLDTNDDTIGGVAWLAWGPRAGN